MGEWDLDGRAAAVHLARVPDAVRAARGGGRARKPAVEVAELDLRSVEWPSGRSSLAGGRTEALRLDAGGRAGRGIAVSRRAAGRRRTRTSGISGRSRRRSPDRRQCRSGSTTPRQLETAVRAPEGRSLAGVGPSTRCSRGYLLDPAGSSSSSTAERAVPRDRRPRLGSPRRPRRAAVRRGRGVGPRRSAAAVALLAPVLDERDRHGRAPRACWTRSSSRCPRSSRGCRRTASRLDVAYLEEMAEGVRDTDGDVAGARSTSSPGEEFNLNSPPQLRRSCTTSSGSQPGRRRPKGELSTDASVLEKLRDAHPIVDAILSWRELDKLNSTYLDALPKQVDPRDGPGAHDLQPDRARRPGGCRSTNPNLQNIPVRGELGRQIRRAFVPESRATCCSSPTTRRSSSGSSRICPATRGCATRSQSGDGHPHGDVGARCSVCRGPGRPASSRRRAKMINYGLAYGMNACGLASRLDIAPDEAQEFIDAYFAGFPQIRDYLDRQVARAAATEGSPRRCSDAAATSRAAGREPAGPRPGPAAWR